MLFSFYVNDIEEVNGVNAHVMCCIIRYNIPINNNLRTKERKGVSYY